MILDVKILDNLNSESWNNLWHDPKPFFAHFKGPFPDFVDGFIVCLLKYIGGQAKQHLIMYATRLATVCIYSAYPQIFLANSENSFGQCMLAYDTDWWHLWPSLS